MLKNIMNTIQNLVKIDFIQAALHKKRFYKKPKISGSEILPLSFLPEQIIIDDDKATNKVTGDEVIAIPTSAEPKNAKSRLIHINFWILAAHKNAKLNAKLNSESLFTETTCCLRNITLPSTIGESDEFKGVKIEMRQIIPNQITLLLAYFTPRKYDTALIKADEKLYYRLFLKCCFTGVREGYSHEPGLTYKCSWCDFQFPGNPRVIDTDIEGKAELEKNNIVINENTFYALLNKIHNLNIVPSVIRPLLTNPYRVLDTFDTSNTNGFSIELDPSTDPFKEHSFKGWNELIKTTIAGIEGIYESSNEEKNENQSEEVKQEAAFTILETMATTSNNYRLIVEKIVEKDKYVKILQFIIKKLSWIQFFNVLQTYFIVPFQRIISNFNAESLSVTEEIEKSLSETHVDDIQYNILDKEIKLYTEFIKTFDQTVKVRSKQNPEKFKNDVFTQMQIFIINLSSMLDYKNKLSYTFITNKAVKDNLLEDTQSIILYGALAVLFTDPDGIVIKDIMIKHVLSYLDKFNDEKLTFNSEEIKKLIEIKNEKERTYVVENFDKLGTDEKQIEKVNKLLGLGKWAVGGTKLIYAYDKDYYDLERERRLDAGIIDFPGMGIDTEFNETPVDDLGFRELNEDEDGYDFDQHRDDDYE